MSDSEKTNARFPLARLEELARNEAYNKHYYRPADYLHKWWARRPGSVFRTIILHTFLDPTADIWEKYYQGANFPGKVVLDPFMGGGTTIVEALRLGCKVIGSDLNPVAWWLVKQAVTDVSLEALDAAFARTEAQARPEIEALCTKGMLLHATNPGSCYTAPIVAACFGDMMPMVRIAARPASICLSPRERGSEVVASHVSNVALGNRSFRRQERPARVWISACLPFSINARNTVLASKLHRARISLATCRQWKSLKNGATSCAFPENEFPRGINLPIRPIYLHRGDMIIALCFVSVLALMLYTLIERDCQASPALVEAGLRTTARALKALSGFCLTVVFLTPSGYEVFWLDTPTGQQALLWRELQLDDPGTRLPAVRPVSQEAALAENLPSFSALKTVRRPDPATYASATTL